MAKPLSDEAVYFVDKVKISFLKKVIPWRQSSFILLWQERRSTCKLQVIFMKNCINFAKKCKNCINFTKNCKKYKFYEKCKNCINSAKNAKIAFLYSREKNYYKSKIFFLSLYLLSFNFLSIVSLGRKRLFVKSISVKKMTYSEVLTLWKNEWKMEEFA